MSKLIGAPSSVAQLVANDTLLHSTASYAAPEVRARIRNRERISRSEISANSQVWENYSIGVTIAEILSSITLVNDATAQEVTKLLSQMQPHIRKLFFPNEYGYFKRFILKLVADEPEDRYQTIEEAWHALRRIEPRNIAFGAIPDLTGVGCRKEINNGKRRIRLSEAAFRWIAHPAFQRLHNLNQLNFVYLVYPGAKRSRFAHSLEAFETARDFAHHLLNDPNFRFIIDESDLSMFLAASLLHDVGHYPLAHMLDEMRPKHPPEDPLDLSVIRTDDEMTRYFLQCTTFGPPSSITEPLWTILGNDGIDPERLSRLVSKAPVTSHADKIIQSLLDGTVDIDKVAYLRMDSEQTEVSFGNGIDLAGLLPALTVILPEERLDIAQPPRLGIIPQGVSAAESVITARYHMFDRVYWHRANRAIMSMIAYVARHLFGGQQGSQQIVGFRQYIEETSNMTDMEALRWLSNRMDYAIQHDLVEGHNGRRCGNPLHGIIHSTRELHKKILSISSPIEYNKHAYLTSECDLDEQERLRCQILDVITRKYDSLAVADHEVLFDIPKKHLVAEALFDDLQVIDQKKHSIRPFTDYSDIASATREEYRKRANRCRVFVSSRIAGELDDDQKLRQNILDLLPRTRR